MQPGRLSPNAASAGTSQTPTRADDALGSVSQWQAAAADMQQDQGLLLLSFLELLSHAGEGEDIQKAARAFAPVAEATCLVDVMTRRRVQQGVLLLQQAEPPADVRAHTELVHHARALQRTLREYAGSLAEDAGAHHRRADPN